MKRKLLAGLSGILVTLAVFAVYAIMQIRATRQECAQSLAGDSLISNPIGAVNHAITIHRPPRDVCGFGMRWFRPIGSSACFRC